MVIPQEIVTLVGDLVRRVDLLVAFTDVDGKKQTIATLEQKISEAKFWNNPDEAREIMQQLSALKGAIEVVITLRNKILELDSFMALLREEDDESLLVDFKKDVNKLSQELDNREITLFLSGKHDRCNAILTIHTGAGGTESCDWADMLLRMYLRWTECRGFGVEIQDIQPGEEAGIGRATIRIIGQNAYGYAKSERGVHRLVRISPFDANKRRHTSFCAVDVIAEIEGDDEIEIRDDEIRIDTYRSSGKGGQHVNKTESAIRITHLPTGIVVTCQNERSQYKNKDFAMKTLRSRLWEKMEDEKRGEMEKFYGEKGEMGWGYQIRSYVLQPYQMVKDLRTGIENSDVMSVLNGDIDFFINGWLRAGCPKARQRHTRLNK